MIKIGIISRTPELAEAVRGLFAVAGQTAYLQTNHAPEVENVYYAMIYDLMRCGTQEAFDMLVINDLVDEWVDYFSLRENGFLLANTDHKNICRGLPAHKGVLITYGFSGKACVTASSVMDGETQLCIRRRLPTLIGHMLEEQEFCVYRAHQNVYDTLSAVTAVMLSGVEIAELAAQQVV